MYGLILQLIFHDMYILDRRKLCFRSFNRSKQSFTYVQVILPTVSAETSAPRTPQPGGPRSKRGPINSQYVVLFTQRMIKVS